MDAIFDTEGFHLHKQHWTKHAVSMVTALPNDSNHPGKKIYDLPQNQHRNRLKDAITSPRCYRTTTSPKRPLSSCVFMSWQVRTVYIIKTRCCFNALFEMCDLYVFIMMLLLNRSSFVDNVFMTCLVLAPQKAQLPGGQQPSECTISTTAK